MDPRSYLIIVNPAAGSGQGTTRARTLASALESLARDVRTVETSGRGAARALAGEAAGSVDRIVAVGGDGTLNEVVAGLLQTGRPAAERPEVAFLASGTGNAAARAFGLTRDPRALAEKLPRARPRAVDVGLATWNDTTRPFLLWMGAGYDAVAIGALHQARTREMGVGSMLRWIPAVAGAVRRYPAPPIRPTVDGRDLAEAESVVVANVGALAFAGSVADVADPCDGRLDVVAVPPTSALRKVRLALGMAMGSLHRGPGVQHATGERIRLESDGEVPLQLDGEPVGSLPVEVEVRRGAVRLLEA